MSSDGKLDCSNKILYFILRALGSLSSNSSVLVKDKIKLNAIS
jgi:hypothetical protein